MPGEDWRRLADYVVARRVERGIRDRRAFAADPTLRHLANTPGLPPDVVRGLIALARNWRDREDGMAEPVERRA